jgi:xyloglucan-specific exo-beta-1,4-glucanase
MKLKIILYGFIFLLFGLSTKAQTTYNWSNVAIGGGGFVTGIITSKTTANLMYARTDVGGAYRWDATNSKWIPLLDWCSINEMGYQGVESISLDAQAPNNIYMLVGTSYFNGGKTAILRSTDQGNTFTITDVSGQFKAHGNGMGRQNGERLAVDPNLNTTLFCGSRANGLWKSTNSGASWSSANTGALTVTTTANGNGINFVVYDPAGTVGTATQTFFVGVSQTTNNLYKTTNGGSSFTAVTGGPSLMPQRAVMASDKNLYITYADNEGPWNINNGQIWKYNTTTSVWTNVTPSGYTVGFGGISVDPSNPNRLIASSTNAYWFQYTDAGGNNVWGDRFFLSTNGGTSWTDLASNPITINPNGITWIPGNSIHWAGCIEFNPFNTNQAHVISGNGLFTCNNVNATNTTWLFNSVGIEETVPLDIASITGGGPLISVIGDYDGFVHTNVTNFAPIHTPRMGTSTGIAYAANSTSKLLRVGANMYYSTNQGSSWTQCTMNGTQGKVAISADGSIFLHCPSTSSTMYRSTNNGSSWTTATGINITNAVPVADYVNTNKFYAYDNSSGNVLISTNAGASFSVASNVASGGSTIMRTVPGNEGHLWLALYSGGLRRSVNSGTSFTNISAVTTCDAVGIGKAAPAAGYYTIYIWGTVGGVLGIHRSIDQGATWTRVNDDANEFGGPGNGQFVIGDMNVYGRVFMSTVGRGIVYGDISVAAPVALISFTAEPENRAVHLSWETASEVNSNYFVVERSSDGETYKELGTINSSGNSSVLHTYNFQDKDPVAGYNYYRLKQVDINNEYTYSEVRKIDMDLSGEIVLFPNPAKNSITVGMPDALVNMEVYDALGNIIYKKTNTQETETTLDVSNFKAGIYTVKINTESNSYNKNFIKE